jgi:hypothetical protein
MINKTGRISNNPLWAAQKELAETVNLEKLSNKHFNKLTKVN